MKIDKLIKQLLKRQEFLESIDYTQQTLGRLKELNLVILIVEQLATNEDTKEVNIFDLIREELDDWIFAVEDQAGVKLKVVDSADFNEIIINIRDKSKT